MTRAAKYSEEIQEKILTLARAGNYRATIADAVGITRETIYAWLKTRPEFAAKLREAEAEAEQNQLAKVFKSDDPKWAIEWLKRRRPTWWGDNARPDPEDVDSPEEREALEDLIAKAKEEARAEMLAELEAKRIAGVG